MGIWSLNLCRAYPGAVTAMLSLTGMAVSQESGRPMDKTPIVSVFSGSASCRSCHERFYSLWSTSFHGRALQPYTQDWAARALTPQTEPVRVGPAEVRAVVDGNDPDAGLVLETGPQGRKAYRIEHVMGGKNVTYFLTPLDRGRLQVLPVAYDVRRRQWYNTTESMVRHVPGLGDAALDWRDPALTFNTSCYTCHVSQLAPNYDPNTDTFRTTWGEPGIACETCHGEALDHVRVCKQAADDRPPADLKLITVSRKRGFSASRIDSACAPCHAKMTPLTGRVGLGDDFFDHYGLTTLEDPDFFPDGRDLGENFTYTLWRMSPCVQSGQLDCMHCHTSSGRYRFAGPGAAEQACLPCHRERVDRAAEHAHHEPQPGGPTCVSCHMPMTEFARMRRSDHSMRPPMPAATIAFGSPNACTLCHQDRDAAWADKQVRSWHSQDYQAPVLYVAGLVAEARRGDWRRLPALLEYVQDRTRDEVFANSLIRLVSGCEDPRKWPVLVDRLRNDPSPLIRGSAAEGLSSPRTPEVISALADATQDPVRLVRVRAGAGLMAVPEDRIPSGRRDSVRRAAQEYVDGLRARGYQWDAQYNLGNVFMDRGRFDQAVRHYRYAVQLRPDSVPALVNAATCYNLMGQDTQAEKALRQAIQAEPNHVAGHLNLGLLLGELGRFPEAAAEFRATLRLDPNSAVAAYNLAEILKADQPSEALVWYRKAADVRPGEGKYGYALALYLAQSGGVSEAVGLLESLVRDRADYGPVYLLLGQIYRQQGRIRAAIDLFAKAAANDRLPQADRQFFREQIQRLQQ